MEACACVSTVVSVYMHLLLSSSTAPWLTSELLLKKHNVIVKGLGKNPTHDWVQDCFSSQLISHPDRSVHCEAAGTIFSRKGIEKMVQKYTPYTENRIFFLFLNPFLTYVDNPHVASSKIRFQSFCIHRTAKMMKEHFSKSMTLFERNAYLYDKFKLCVYIFFYT